MADAGGVRRQVRQRLDDLKRSGIVSLPKRHAAAAQLTADSTKTAARADARSEVHVERFKSPVAAATPTDRSPLAVSASKPAPAPPATWQPSAAAGPDSLEGLRAEVAACTRCRELACTRTQTVFGVGNPHPRLCFLGEAPGADEDRQGEPFVGRAGQLLNRIIEACTLRREDVYILNVLKCRPPGNRNPSPDEAANCRPFLDRQLALIQPEFICCLGAVAARNLLATETSIGKLRGRVFEYGGAKVVCT
jgi:DNA polymerase